MYTSHGLINKLQKYGQVHILIKTFPCLEYENITAYRCSRLKNIYPISLGASHFSHTNLTVRFYTIIAHKSSLTRSFNLLSDDNNNNGDDNNNNSNMNRSTLRVYGSVHRQRSRRKPLIFFAQLLSCHSHMYTHIYTIFGFS
jgi:hypothetical protein